jgi:hypothetical protein
MTNSQGQPNMVIDQFDANIVDMLSGKIGRTFKIEEPEGSIICIVNVKVQPWLSDHSDEAKEPLFWFEFPCFSNQVGHKVKKELLQRLIKASKDDTQWARMLSNMTGYEKNELLKRIISRA